MADIKNFGIVDELTVVAAGLNGKMGEVNAAFGLLQLNYVDAAVGSRQLVDKTYRDLLADTPGIRCMEPGEKVSANYSYFPVLVEDDFPISRNALYDKLKQENIFNEPKDLLNKLAEYQIGE